MELVAVIRLKRRYWDLAPAIGPSIMRVRRDESRPYGTDFDPPITKLKELISMKCPDCGTSNFSHAEYCRKCQRDLRRASREQVMAKRDRSVFSLRVER